MAKSFYIFNKIYLKCFFQYFFHSSRQQCLRVLLHHNRFETSRFLHVSYVLNPSFLVMLNARKKCIQSCLLLSEVDCFHTSCSKTRFQTSNLCYVSKHCLKFTANNLPCLSCYGIFLLLVFSIVLEPCTHHNSDNGFRCL
jgi:hypothetical protein